MTGSFENIVADTLGNDLPADTGGGNIDVNNNTGNTNNNNTANGNTSGQSQAATGPDKINAALDRIDGKPANEQQPKLDANGKPIVDPKQQQQQQPGKQPIKDFETNEPVQPGQMQRYFFGMKNAQRELAALKPQVAELAQLRGEVVAYRNSAQAAAQLKLTAEDQGTAFQLLASLRKDTKGTLKKLLTEMQANGIDLSEITGGQGALNADVLSRMIDEKLAPVTGAFRQQHEHAAIVNEVETEFASLYESVPEARQNEGVLGAILERNPNMTASQAWYELANRAMRAGFDVSKPLLQQMQARAQNGGQQQQPIIPTGRQGGNGAQPVVNAGRSMSPTASMKDIVADAMREAGLNVH